MANKKPEETGKRRNPDGSTEVTYLDGSVIRTNPDGSKDFIDATGKALTKLSITETQIEAWKKMPDEEALKEGIALFRMENMDVPEARQKLEVLKFLCEIRGVMQPAQQKGATIVAIRIDTGTSQNIKVIEANAKETITLPS